MIVWYDKLFERIEANLAATAQENQSITNEQLFLKGFIQAHFELGYIDKEEADNLEHKIIYHYL